MAEDYKMPICLDQGIEKRSYTKIKVNKGKRNMKGEVN